MNATLFRASRTLALFALAAGAVAVSGCGLVDGGDVDDLLGGGGGDPGPVENPCAATLCKQGQVCVVLKSNPPQAQCIDQEPPQSNCYSSKDCGAGEICSVERGDCLPPAGCGKDRPCPAVCTGVCEKAPPPIGACRIDSDCKLISNYCGGCQCDVVGPLQALRPAACEKPVACLVDPCQGAQAVCVSGACQLAAPIRK